MLKMKYSLFITTICVSLLSACGESSSESASARLTLNITDAPVDEADAVVVQFSSVTLRPTQGEEIVFDFSAEPKTIDLLALQGVASQPLIEDEEIPAGDYNQIRLGVNAEFDDVYDSYITINGIDHELRVPSGSQNGLKLNTPFSVATGTEGISVDDDLSVYTIDFDLRKSVVNPVGQEGYFLKPVLRLVQNVNTGSISGLVDGELLIAEHCTDDDPLTGNAVYVFSGADITPDDVDEIDADPLTTSLVAYNENDGSYSYEIGYLSAGNYTVALTCNAELETEADDSPDMVFDPVDNVVVEAGANSDLPITATP